MVITQAQLKKISPGTPDNLCELFARLLSSYCPKYAIDTPNEMASFLSQVLHETGGFKFLKEIWGPTAVQSRYEFRKDLGNIKAGDGKLYKGRGLIHITGRKNYERMSMDLFGDLRLLETPEILEQPVYAVQSACIYWTWRKLDAVDDDNDILKETKAVNGGYNGLNDRRVYFNRAMATLQAA